MVVLLMRLKWCKVVLGLWCEVYFTGYFIRVKGV